MRRHISPCWQGLGKLSYRIKKTQVNNMGSPVRRLTIFQCFFHAFIWLGYPDRWDWGFFSSVYEWGLRQRWQSLWVLFWRLHSWLMNVVSVYTLTKTEKGCISIGVGKSGQSSVTKVKESPCILKHSERKWIFVF